MPEEKKSSLEKQLSWTTESYWLKMDEKKQKAVFDFAEDYKKFLKEAKTEREAVEYFIAEAEKNGFKPIDKAEYKPGEKIYLVNRGKNIALVVIGEKPLTEGVKIVAAHVDAPRVDLKPNPLYEDGDLALLKTHYYGGIKKYQWVNMPLALHGVVITKDGKKLNIKIGESDDDPVFVMTDLLPHLSRKVQNERKLPEGIAGEELRLIVGHIPINDENVKAKFKTAVLKYLNEKYGMVEEDFASAELEIVPAFKPRDIGFDRGLVAGYGQDDRICGFTAGRAAFALGTPKYTAIALLVDKEEIGSEGNTGMKSMFIRNIIGDLLALQNKDYNERDVRLALTNAKALSADVCAAFNPVFPQPFDKQDTPIIGRGAVLIKYTGVAGKAGANDAHAEFIGEIRLLLNKHNIPWQVGELGKVDQGGGGTVAKFLAEHGMDVIDCGPPILGMHSPYEISSKADLYSAYEIYKVFLEE